MQELQPDDFVDEASGSAEREEHQEQREEAVDAVRRGRGEGERFRGRGHRKTPMITAGWAGLVGFRLRIA